MLQVCVLKGSLRDRCFLTPGAVLQEGFPFEESFLLSRFLQNAKFVFSKRAVLKSKRLGKEPLNIFGHSFLSAQVIAVGCFLFLLEGVIFKLL